MFGFGVPQTTSRLLRRSTCISTAAEGRFFLSVGDNEDAPVDEDRALSLASAVLRRNPDTPVLVKADQKVPYGRVVEAMVLLQQAGAQKVGFLTDPPDTSTRRRGQN